MAKQYGIHKIGGKVDGQSYYYSKNGGFVSRKINPGMSARVKEGKEYANTRLNNAEFGAAGKLAGAMVGTVSQRWRYILDSIATGKLVGVIKAAMMQDDISVWGQRTVPLAEMAGIQDAYNRFSKNDVPQEILSALQQGLSYNTTNNTIVFGASADIASDTAQQFKDKGVSNFSLRLFAFNVTKPVPGEDGKTYKDATPLLVELPRNAEIIHGEMDEGVEVIAEQSIAGGLKIFNEESHLGGLLAVFLPERKVANQYYTMQELCSACWIPATEVTA